MIALVGILVLATPPAVGDAAPPFDLLTLNKQVVRLRPLLQRGPVVLVVLRGWPGYQCPFCTRQVGELMGKSPDFEKAKATVVLVYPGPKQGLTDHATEFVSGKSILKRFRFALDPGFAFVNAYGLRWDAVGETAYPSTFVIGRDGKVVYAKVGHGHGDRAPVADVLTALSTKP